MRPSTRWKPSGSVRVAGARAEPAAQELLRMQPEQWRPAAREERRAWRVAKTELRVKWVDLEHCSGQGLEGGNFSEPAKLGGAAGGSRRWRPGSN